MGDNIMNAAIIKAITPTTVSNNQPAVYEVGEFKPVVSVNDKLYEDQVFIDKVIAMRKKLELKGLELMELRMENSISRELQIAKQLDEDG